MTRDRSAHPRMLAAAGAGVIALMLVLGAAVSAQDGASGRWTERLEALSPDHPVGYFELAEEIADSTDNENQLALARRLFKLAGVLSPERMGRSVCLALAELEPVPQTRSRYLVLASLLDETVGLSPWHQPVAGETIPPTAAMAVSEAFGHFRQGQGPRAIAALRDGDALSYLERQDFLMPYGLRRFLADCNLYRGGRRPTLARTDLVRMLRVEDALLSGAERGWASDLLLTQARPLIEVDPGRLGQELGLSAKRPYFRNGQWVSRDAASADRR